MTKAPSWIVREAVLADEKQLADLYQVVFGVERRTENYQWKFRDNPHGQPVIAVADDNGNIVGQYALWPTRLRLGSSSVLGAQSLDTMTHPDYRGQGMFTRLAEECMRYAASRGIVVLYGFPNENSFPGFIRKLNWDCTGNVPIWVRPLRPSRHHRVPAWVGPLADLGARALPAGRIGNLRIEIERPDSTALHGLLDDWNATPGRCRVERTFDRYVWRFSEKAGMHYKWVCAYDGAVLVSFAVWGIDLRNGNAVLSEALGKDSKAVEAVIAGAVRAAMKTECPIMLAVSSYDEYWKALTMSGFVKSGSIPFIVRKLTTQTLGANVHTHALWDIFGADLDTF